MDEERSQQEGEESVDSEKHMEVEIMNLEKEIERLRIEYATLFIQQKYMHDARDFLLLTVDSIIREEESSAEEIETVESESEGTVDSEKSDSDYEVADEKDNSGSESKEEVYHRPTTRSSTQNALVEPSDESNGIQTRSKTKKSELNASDPASKVEARQEDSDALLLYSLKNPGKPKQTKPNSVTASAKSVTTSEKDAPTQSSSKPTEVPFIPSAAPLLINNPSSGDPPKLSEVNKTTTKRPLPDMSFLIPSLSCLSPESAPFSYGDQNGAGKLPNQRTGQNPLLLTKSNSSNTPNPSSTPSTAKQTQSASPALATKKPRNQPIYSTPKVSKATPKTTNTMPRSMIQNVIYNPQGASSMLQPIPSQSILPSPLVANDSIVYPLKAQSTKRPYPGIVDMNTLYPNYTPIQPGFEYPSPMSMPRNTPAMGSIVNTGYGVPPQLFTARQMPIIPGYIPQSINGRAVDFPTAVYQTPAGFMGPVVTLPNDGKVSMQLSQPKMQKINATNVAPQGVNQGLIPSVQGTVPQMPPQGTRSIYIPAISADEEGNILPNN